MYKSRFTALMFQRVLSSAPKGEEQYLRTIGINDLVNEGTINAWRVSNSNIIFSYVCSGNGVKSLLCKREPHWDNMRGKLVLLFNGADSASSFSWIR